MPVLAAESSIASRPVIVAAGRLPLRRKQRQKPYRSFHMPPDPVQQSSLGSAKGNVTGIAWFGEIRWQCLAFLHDVVPNVDSRVID
jgi:hypothetical protein